MSSGFTIPRRERLGAWANRVPLPLVAFEPANVLLLTGSSRSGTTWVGRLLSAGPTTCLANEPLSLKMPGLLAAGFSWRTWVDPEDPWPQGQEIFDRYFRGAGLTVKLVLRNRFRPWRWKRLVLKAVRANRLLPWLQARYDLGAYVLLVRHPCAVVSSQMINFGLRGLTVEDDLRYLERRLPHLVDWAHGLETEEERRALAWALDQHAALSGADPESTVLVLYERLVARGDEEVARLLTAAGVPEAIPHARDRLRENSWQAREASVDHPRASVAARLGVWRERLEDDQIRRILEVVERVGIRGYGRDLLPAPEGITLAS